MHVFAKFFKQNLSQVTFKSHNSQPNKYNLGLLFVAEPSCLDPICNMSIDSVTKQLNVATKRIKMLQMQLAQISQKNGNVEEIETVL